MGIDVHNDVFFSSLEGIKIPPGEDFKRFIKEQIQQPDMVLPIISQNYLASQFCLAELGASWAMSHRVIPFLVAPITYADMNEGSSCQRECLEDRRSERLERSARGCSSGSKDRSEA